ncbi:FAD-dependent oxidoreductase [Candidatus Microgenomates bacterium]|nr:FAD-dependent oxidoreductase [Candidatus Microgenomates bacterium]
MRVVIVGGGFGGIQAARRLAGRSDFAVKLISDRPYFEYHAALYRSATGRSPLEVAIPLAELFDRVDNVEVVADKIISIDHEQKILVGDSNSSYAYDVVVLAVGVVTQYFGIKGLDKFTYGIKSVHEALRLKRHLHEELAAKPIGVTNYVVVGGGPTGVELAGELVTYLNRIRRRHRLASKPYQVIMVEAADRLMGMLPKRFARRVSKRLQQLGVQLRLGVPVEGETATKLLIPGPDIPSHSVIWTAGTANNPLFASHEQLFRFGQAGRVVVNRYLEAQPDLYVIGDCADTKYSGMAQTALHQATYVVDNLLRQQRHRHRLAYRPKPPIYAIPVGPHWAAAKWGPVYLYGYSGWLLRRLADWRLFMKFLPFGRAWAVWRHEHVLTEACPECVD